MSNLKQISDAEAELIKLDPILGKLIEQQKPINYVINQRRKDDYLFSLCRSIVGQQVSVKAADAIFSRLEAATAIKPKALVMLNDLAIKEIGLSRQKAIYIQDLAKHFFEDPLIYNHLDKLTDDEVITELTSIKGVGLWTAQMFLIFTLGRLDVFAPGDVGIQRAMKILYGSGTVLSRQELTNISEHWRPYRTVAIWHLWKLLNNTPDNIDLLITS
jgi:DNA-3-methyladenine glycosylase II